MNWTILQRPRARKIASTVALASTTATAGLFAFFYDGTPTADVSLHEAGVWVTNASKIRVGRINNSSEVLDASVRVSADIDVMQDGTDVLVHDRTSGTISTVDPATVLLAATAEVPAGAQVGMGGGRIAVLDPTDGALWVTALEALGSFVPLTDEPLGEFGAGAVLAVGPDGAVAVASPSAGTLSTVSFTEAGPVLNQGKEREGIGASDILSVTLVGETPVALDHTTGTLFLPGGEIPVEDAPSARLQQSAIASDSVTYATPAALITQPLAGGEPRVATLDVPGVAAAPVTLKGCSYGAWSTAALLIRDCADDSYDVRAPLEGLVEGSVLVFRVNRDAVVLNETLTGVAWMASDAMQRVDNWRDVSPEDLLADDDQEEQTADLTDSQPTTLPERSEQNNAPTANDDAFGVRAGTTVTLPVVDNDIDPDNDVLAVTLSTETPAGLLQPILGGGALQLRVEADVTGTHTFDYTVADGRGGEDIGTVVVTVTPEGSNGAPVQTRRSRTFVDQGASVTYNVLPDWTDPDGDTIFLKDVSALPGSVVEFTADGRITITAGSLPLGPQDFAITLSDGIDNAAGTLRVNVNPAGTSRPIVNADHVTTTVGRPVIVAPLANDASTSGRPLRLAKVNEIPGLSVVQDDLGNTLTVTSSIEGTFYIQYLVTDDFQEGAGLIRVDVVAEQSIDLPPVAVRDVALVPAGDDVLVDVLYNDYDPAGGLLVVQSVNVPANSGVSAVVIDHSLVRVTNTTGIEEPVEFTYRVSNGTQWAEGTVVVIPVVATDKVLPPVAADDAVVVRAGDIASFDVLDNDYHPSKREFELVSALVAEPDPAQGEAFTSDGRIRFRAGSTPGTAFVTYEVMDETGQKDAALVTVTIISAETGNSAPRPADVTARGIAGETVRVPIPLDGIDADGDSVTLVGASSALTKGRIAEVGTDYFTIELFATAAGTEKFTYVVRDNLGAEATASVTYAVAPPEAQNSAPVANKDSLSVRPSRTVAVPVLVNDLDPDGDAISLVADSIVAPEGLTATASDGYVTVVSEAVLGTFSVQYGIVDARGLKSTSVIEVTVDPDVPLYPPVARDDVVFPADLADDGTAVVTVLDNDEDRDGVTSELAIAVADPAMTVNPDGTVGITVGPDRQIVRYTLTDVDGLQGSAFIIVPGMDEVNPSLKPLPPLEVTTGERVEIQLSDWVRTGGGTPAVITEAESVRANNSNGDSLVVDGDTLAYTSREDYVGADAITLEVTDGTGPDDPDGRKATLSIPILVIPKENTPPTLDGAQLDVAAGEGPQTIDLKSLATDPDDGDLDALTYAMDAQIPDGVSVSVEGNVLSASAEVNVAKGTIIPVTVTATDGESDPVAAIFSITVLSSTKPVAIPTDDVVPNAMAGTAVPVDVTLNDTNPFPETPLQVTEAVVESGSVTAPPTIANGVVTFTPAADFFGTIVVRYTVLDATQDADRAVDGRIRATVAARPAAPSTPTVVSQGDRNVILTWTAPANNGRPITTYTVTDSLGGTRPCPATTCTISGLTNNTEYRFTVTATNAVGISDPSPQSAPARPDVKPATPAAPALAFGDKSLAVTWTTPATLGSPVTSFNLEISPAPPSGPALLTGITGNAYTWTGLENGTAYRVRAQANNASGTPSDWSPYSATQRPAGVPNAPAKPTTTRLAPVGERAQLQVQWVQPAGNGDTVSSYTVQARQGTTVVQEVTAAAGVTTQAFVVDTSTSNYTFTVIAHNKAGASPVSVASDPRRAFVAPGAPTVTTWATPTSDGRIWLDYTAGPLNGADASWVRYEYELNGNGTWRAMPAAVNRTCQPEETCAAGQGIALTGLNNGSSYRVRVRGVVTADGATYNGTPSAQSGTAVPFGVPNTPGVSGSADAQAHFTITAPAPNGRAISGIEYRTNESGGAWTGWTNLGILSGSRVVNVGPGTAGANIGIQVRAAQAETYVWSATAATSVNTQAPVRRAWVTRGSESNTPGCSDTSCAHLVLNYENIVPGTYDLYCRDDYGSDSYITQTRYTRTLGATGSVELGCYFGHPGWNVYIELRDYWASDWYNWPNV